MSDNPPPALSVIHVLRTPVGGLFRHVCDLTKMQSEAGLQVGIFCDSETGGENAAGILKLLEHNCSLGIHRFPVGRLPGISDWTTIRRLRKSLATLSPDILHGHGAKGGAYARILGHSINAKAFYTPHGGSLHYKTGSLSGFIFFRLESMLSRRTDGIIFECAFSQKTYRRKIGNPSCAMRIIHNGISDDDFQPRQLDGKASDFVFVGELRHLKGVDILLKALAILQQKGLQCSCTIVGEGPDAGEFKKMSGQLDLKDCVKFTGFQPASKGFSLGRHLVIPSRAESFPYIILEGAAAGMPIITTRVGGIAEIFGEQASLLVTPDNVENLGKALEFALKNPDKMTSRAEILHQRVKQRFKASTMAAATIDFYSSV